MSAYLLKRCLLAVFVLWGAVSIVFVLLRMAPGDPAELQLGLGATQEQLAAFRERAGLAGSIVSQYVSYFAHVVRFQFGNSLISNSDAAGLVLQRFPQTALLAVSAMVLALVLSFPLGVAAARWQGSRIDRAISFFSISGQSLPSFWVGIMLILIFARNLKLLPSAGSGSPLHLILPAVTLAIPLTSVLARFIRSGLLDVSREGYIQTARAKGLPEHVVLLHHALRTMLIPVVTVAGLQFGHLLGGTVVVETVFAWPGIGRLLVDSIGNRDYAVVQACTLLIAAVFVILNLIVDVTYQYLDPRVRAGA
ncbi:MAG: ABC transporter permease [Bauldia sp.]